MSNGKLLRRLVRSECGRGPRRRSRCDHPRHGASNTTGSGYQRSTLADDVPLPTLQTPTVGTGRMLNCSSHTTRWAKCRPVVRIQRGVRIENGDASLGNED